LGWTRGWCAMRSASTATTRWPFAVTCCQVCRFFFLQFNLQCSLYFAAVDQTLCCVGNHDLGFLAPRELVFRGAAHDACEQSTQLWGVQSSPGQPSVKSELLNVLLSFILKKPGVSDQELARVLPIVPLSDIRDVPPPPHPSFSKCHAAFDRRHCTAFGRRCR
jgi:hypothetical protein